ncbi:hypothetical protein AB6A40_008403 [Gnathostoma spinigerum]|uniref:Uncharacterized protein n=1 Tax=Gnathostoma spinigerum TaxID=75299 RepID=A0ABD6EWQ4_9BILA
MKQASCIVNLPAKIGMDETSEVTAPETASSEFSGIGRRPFLFAPLTPLEIPNYHFRKISLHELHTPTTVQKDICLNAASNIEHSESNDDDFQWPAAQRKVCSCSSRLLDVCFSNAHGFLQS